MEPVKELVQEELWKISTFHSSGKINETFDSFLKQLEISLSAPINSKQIRIKHLFHTFLDGKNSERVSRKILSSL